MKLISIILLFSSLAMSKPSLTEVLEKTRCIPRRSAVTGEIEGESCFNPKDVRGQKSTEKSDSVKNEESKKANDEEVEKIMKDIK